MESSPNFHHQLQDHQLLLHSPLPTSPNSPSSYALAWPQHPISCLSTRANFHQNINIDEAFINSRADPNSPMLQELGFQWSTRSNATTTGTGGVSFAGSSNQSPHDLQLERIKEEFSDTYPKYADMVNSPTSSLEGSHIHPLTYMMKNDQQQRDNPDHKLSLLKNFTSGCQINGLPSGGEFMFYSNDNNNNSQNCSAGRATFSHIFPTVNISNLNHSPITSTSLDMNLPPLDLFGSARFSGSDFFQPPSNNNHHLGGIYKDATSSYGLDHIEQLAHRPTNNPKKISSTFNSGGGGGGGTDAKRPASNFMETKAPHQATAQKKSRLESPRSSCPPFKVRKEKLGDRIAALQQLVAPFGKTDTASVLMEAIGYIKFLQSQIETLSVPYMKSSQNKCSRRILQGGSMEDGNEDEKRDLRSRGLCLVPLPCLSYVTDGGGGVWPS